MTQPKFDVPDFWSIIGPELRGIRGRGATFGMEFSRTSDHGPEILLSFGFVPKLESDVGLINWLIQDPGNAALAREQAFVTRLAASDPAFERRALLDLYQRVIDLVAELGFLQPRLRHIRRDARLLVTAIQSATARRAHGAPEHRPLSFLPYSYLGRIG